jgi:pSer/pThr/pTyr-binding forkhead associated (FHA) protein
MPVRFRIHGATKEGPSDGPSAVAAERVVDVPDPRPEIRLGRRADLELPLPFATLSSIHARVGVDGQSYWLEDAGSTNGTRLEGARLVPGERRALSPGAELHLAQIRLSFEGPVAAATPPSDAPTDPSEGTATIARRLVADLLPDAVAPTLTVSTGAPPGQLPLADEAHPYVVGRSPTCALPLDVEHVSREHAAFLRTATGAVARDLDSKNGVLVNGVRITSDHPLSDGDTIQIGPVTLTLEDPISRYLRELANQAEPVAESPAVHAPAPVAPPRASAFSRLSTTISIVVLALVAVLVLALLR